MQNRIKEYTKSLNDHSQVAWIQKEPIFKVFQDRSQKVEQYLQNAKFYLENNEVNIEDLKKKREYLDASSKNLEGVHLTAVAAMNIKEIKIERDSLPDSAQNIEKIQEYSKRIMEEHDNIYDFMHGNRIKDNLEREWVKKANGLGKNSDVYCNEVDNKAKALLNPERTKLVVCMSPLAYAQMVEVDGRYLTRYERMMGKYHGTVSPEARTKAEYNAFGLPPYWPAELRPVYVCVTDDSIHAPDAAAMYGSVGVFLKWHCVAECTKAFAYNLPPMAVNDFCVPPSITKPDKNFFSLRKRVDNPETGKREMEHNDHDPVSITNMEALYKEIYPCVIEGYVLGGISVINIEKTVY